MFPLVIGLLEKSKVILPRRDKRLKGRIPGLKTLSSFSNENGSKVPITGQRGLRINEIENESGDRNLLDWTSKNIRGSKI
ncbi:hypothetical protein Tco_1574421, partial [Tanacetum coccineum]